MSTPTTEVVIFKASKKYQEDSSIITRLFDVVLKADGAHGTAYYGQQVQDPATGYLFLDWDSYAHHKALVDGSTYGEVLRAFEPCAKGTATTYHVKFSGPVSTALALPVAHVVVLSVKPGVHRAAIQTLLAELESTTSKLRGEKAILYGQTMEDPGKYVVLCGWPSEEARKSRIMANQAVGDECRAKTRSLVEFDEVYATVKSYSK